MIGKASIGFDWNRTRAFLVTAEEGSFSAAAKKLDMAQPTLSRQVAALERDLAVTLFERGGQRLVLTQSGQELLLHAKQMAIGAEKFSLTAAGHSQQLEGLVTISAGQLDAIYRLPKIIKRIKETYPGIDIEVVVTNSPSDLNKREADIAIRNFRPTQTELIAKKLGSEEIWLVGSEEYLQPFKEIDKLSELKDIQIIGFENDKKMIETLNQKDWLLDETNVQIMTEFQPMQIQLCKQSLGLIFLSQYAIKAENELKKFLEKRGPIMTLPLWLVCHQELRTNLRVRKVFDIIANELV